MSPAIHPSAIELADLVCAMRYDWERADVDGAIHAAGMARRPDDDPGRAFARVAAELVRLAGDLDSMPRALTDAIRNALARGPKLPPERNAELADEARRGMLERLDVTDAEGCAE